MGTLERTETLSHRLGADGRVSVKTITGRLHVRGIDGDEARLTVTYRIRAADQAAAERVLDGGRVLVDRGPGSLEVETPERRLATGLAWLLGGARVSADISLEVPWGARVRLETMNGPITASALVGEQKYRTVSGEIDLWGLAGVVEASSISGSIALDQGGDLRLRASSVSGGLRVRAALFHGLVLSTTSGGMAVAGSFDPSGDYRAESISGSVELAPFSGVTAELKSISGSVRTETGQRLEGGRGFWRAIVGDGGSTFRVSSTSGSLRLLAPQPGESPVRAAAPSRSAAPADPAGTPVAGVPDAPSELVPSASGSWDPGESGPPDDPDREEQLAVLQALERGEIGVDEAAERLNRPGGRSDA